MPPRRKIKPRSAELAALGEAIRQFRQEAGLSQERLAHLADTDLRQVGGFERGTRNPSYETLTRLAAALSIRVGALVDLAERLHEQHATDGG